MRAPRARHARMSPATGQATATSASPTLPRRRRRSVPLASVATTPTRPTATCASDMPSSKPLEAATAPSSFSITPQSSGSGSGSSVDDKSEPSGSTITRHGTKRPRGSRDTSPMCLRSSTIEADERVVVALVPHAPIVTPKKTKAVPVTHALACAAATATAHVTARAPFRGSDTDATLRARFQRLLVQFVMLPVVWMSLCCVITAAMGIEAMESLHAALRLEDDDATRPAKKPKHVTRHRSDLRPATDTSDTSDDTGVVVKPKLVPPPSSSSTAVRRRRRVLIWDLDETLVLFASLYSGQYARTHDKDVATSVALGEQMMTYLLAVLERHFFFSDLHNADIDHISCAASEAETIATRYARIRAIYERQRDGHVDFLDDPTSPWFTARQALVTSIDTLSTGWIREARDLLTLTAGTDSKDEIINVMVTNTQLSPALCKCLIYGLDAHFPIDRVYSSSKLHKLRCFQTIMATYAASSGDCDVEFMGIGDGPEEEHVSQALGLPFFKIRSLDDLRNLRHELQLGQEEAPEAVTTANTLEGCTAGVHE